VRCGILCILWAAAAAAAASAAASVAVVARRSEIEANNFQRMQQRRPITGKHVR